MAIIFTSVMTGCFFFSSSWSRTVFCPIVTRQFYGMRCYGELYSTVSTVICVGVIASSFIGGSIVNITGSYLAMFAFIGAALLAACLLLVVAAKLRAKDR